MPRDDPGTIAFQGGEDVRKQMNQATQQILAKAGEEARSTVVEADITAYNASYSLPCRDAKPRLVASFPSRLTAGRSTPIMTLKGNFLRQGELKASVNGVPAQIVERLDRQMSVSIPPQVLASAEQDEVILSTKVHGFEEIGRSLWLFGLLGCHENRKTTAEAPIGLSVLEPPITFNVTGSLKYTHTAYRAVEEPAQPFSSTGSDHCDDSYRVDRQWCIQGPGTLKDVRVTDLSDNCGSGYEGTTPSGDRCTLVRGRVAGCGAVRGPFNAWLGCKGRGWLAYKIQLVRSEPYGAETDSMNVEEVGKPGVRSFNIPMPSPTGLTAPSAWYAVTVAKIQGKKSLDSYAISHANPNTGPVTSRVRDGMLSIDVNEP